MGVPIDDNSGLPLITTKEPERQLDDIILSDENEGKIRNVLKEHRRQNELVNFGLTPTRRLLFSGQPGCGKTLMAEVIASELGVPLVTINPECVLSDCTGDTVINLARVFHYFETLPMYKVVLIAGLDRYLESERVFGVLLHHLNDNLWSKNVFIGTAYRWKAPSDIGWRDQIAEVMLRFEAPHQQQIQDFLKLKTKGFRLHSYLIFDSDLVGMFLGRNYADITQVILMAYKQMVISGDKELMEKHFVEVFALCSEVIETAPCMMREGVRW